MIHSRAGSASQVSSPRGATAGIARTRRKTGRFVLVGVHVGRLAADEMETIMLGVAVFVGTNSIVPPRAVQGRRRTGAGPAFDPSHPVVVLLLLPLGNPATVTRGFHELASSSGEKCEDFKEHDLFLLSYGI